VGKAHEAEVKDIAGPHPPDSYRHSFVRVPVLPRLWAIIIFQYNDRPLGGRREIQLLRKASKIIPYFFYFIHRWLVFTELQADAGSVPVSYGNAVTVSGDFRKFGVLKNASVNRPQNLKRFQL